MRGWLLGVAVLLVALAPLAQGRSFAAIDRYALAATPDDERTLFTLSTYLQAGSSVPVEKARLVYRWTTDRIAYSAAILAMAPQDRPDQSAVAVLQRRNSVCLGYSNLFDALARNVGLETSQVFGDTRDPPGESSDGGHVWNAVKLDGKWHLLDPTWGSGYLDAATGQFHKEFNPYYFLVPPDQLIFSHVPSEDRWQLLATPRTSKDLELLPMVSTGYFRYQVKPAELHGTVAAARSFRFRFTAREGARFSGLLVQGERDLDDTLVFMQHAGREWTADVLFPAPGEYTVRLYGTDDPFADSKEQVVDYTVKAWTGTERRFPRRYRDFEASAAELEYPRTYVLKAGSRTSFSVRVPGAKKVEVASDGGPWLTLTRSKGDYWRGTSARLPAGELLVQATFSGSRGSVLLGYLAK